MIQAAAETCSGNVWAAAAVFLGGFLLIGFVIWVGTKGERCWCGHDPEGD